MNDKAIIKLCCEWRELKVNVKVVLSFYEYCRLRRMEE